MTTRTRTSSRARSAFTLIELLVVMSIIIIIMALLMAAVQKARDSALRTNAQSEIREFGNAIGNFKQKFGVDHIPSRLMLCERWSDYPTSGGSQQLSEESQTWLNSCWRGVRGQNVDWNANGAYDPPVTLEGDQVLVFALGGPQGHLGFSNNRNNPAQAPITGESRIGPFVKFQNQRLRDRSNRGYPSYLDVWEKNYYAYFSSGLKSNNYNRYGSSDCASLGVSPYLESTNKYWLANGFQIISAGKDGVFGPGGAVWPPMANANGRDDMATFSKYMLESNSPE